MSRIDDVRHLNLLSTVLVKKLMFPHVKVVHGSGVQFTVEAAYQQTHEPVIYANAVAASCNLRHDHCNPYPESKRKCTFQDPIIYICIFTRVCHNQHLPKVLPELQYWQYCTVPMCMG
jgi:hypothetical protein